MNAINTEELCQLQFPEKMKMTKLHQEWGMLMWSFIQLKNQKKQEEYNNFYWNFYFIYQQLSSRKFNKLFINVIYFNEEKYAKKELVIPEEEKITLDR